MAHSGLLAVPAFTQLVLPTATGPHRALASVMPMPCMPQSWPRDTQAGPELLPLDSSPPATDADLASVRLLKSPRMPLPPTPTEALPLSEKPSGDSLWPKLSRSVRPTPCLAVPAFTQLVLPTPTGHPRVPTAQLPTTGDKEPCIWRMLSLPHCFECAVLNPT